MAIGEPTQEPDDRVSALEAQVEALNGELETLREQVRDLGAELASRRPALATYRLPETITFADHEVQLSLPDVVERLEREFYVALGNPAQVILWLKRSARFFPYIERELREAGLPDDLKYVAVIESDLRPRAYSSARASGIWQFIASTARLYGLRVTSSWDERRDPVRSTAAAIAYLRDLYARFRDWPLTLAGYNSGEDRVSQAIKYQGVADYYSLALPTETERYFFRALAAKLILEDPARYGFQVPLEERYSPPSTDQVTIRTSWRLRVRDLAGAAGSFYREFRALNPAILSESLPAGRYEVRIPRGHRDRFLASLTRLEKRAERAAVKRVHYRIKRGDTLSDIAQRFGVSISAIRKRNPNARKRLIHPGDVLVIEPARRAGSGS